MPNHVQTVIRSDDEGAMKAFRKLMVDDDGDVDFNRVIPMPQELYDIYAGSCVIDGVRYSRWREIDDQRVPVSVEELLDLTDKYGVTFSNDWGNEHWNTKWNAYDCYADDYVAEFSTAWAHPDPVIVEMSRKLPMYKFHVRYADENIGCNTGDYIILNGEIIFGFACLPEESPAAWETALDIWGCQEYYVRQPDGTYQVKDTSLAA
ncbi:MAG: hypothetical protein WC959_01435 [Kiritimatiellales bacterium]